MALLRFDPSLRWVGRGCQVLVLVGSIVVCLSLSAADEPRTTEAKAPEEMPAKKPNDGPALGSTEQLIAEAARLAPRVKDLRNSKPDLDDDNPIEKYFIAACDRADEKQLRQLFDIYAGLPQSSFERMRFLPFIARRRIELETAKIKNEQVRVSFPETKSEPPAELTRPELVAAWQLHQRAKIAYDKTFPRDTERTNKIDAHVNDKSFQALIRKAFFEKETGIEKELAAYADTGAGCMDVRDISDAQDFANLVILLRERRLDEAVGAALRVAGTQGSFSEPEVCAPAVIEFFQVCGVDWETLYAGAHLSASLPPDDYSDTTPFVEALARYGSARAATLANELSFLAGARARERFVRLFNLWIRDSPTAQKCRGQKVEVGSTSTPSWMPAATVPAEIQRILLGTTEQFIVPDCSESLARTAVHIFGRTQSRSSIPALRQLALHDDKDVARDAATVLCAMDESVPEIAVGAPVRFRLSVNGKPLPLGDHIGYRIETETNNSNGSSAAVGPDGAVELERRWFTHPTKRPTQIDFDHFGGDDPGAPQFNVTVPPPVNLDGITPIEIKASALQLHLRNVARLKAPLPEKTKLYILPAGDHEIEALFQGGAHGLEVVVGESISVPLLEENVYDVGLAFPGAERWHACVAVGPNAEPAEVELKPGSDVRCRIITPTGEEISPSELIKDGQIVKGWRNYETKTFSALGLGNYVLRIYGTQHWKRPDEPRGPDEIAFLGRDVPFTISENSPALIDLGEIHLEADNQ